MTAEQNFFHRWRRSPTIGYELEAIWEMSVYGSMFYAGGEIESCGFDLMKRLLLILGAMGLICVIEGTDPAFARFHNDAPLGGFSLWQIAVGILLLLVLFAAGSSQSKESIEKEKKKNEERIDTEKKKKGIFRYYGEGVGYMLLYWSAPFILVGIIWLFS